VLSTVRDCINSTINIDDENQYRINGVSPPLPEQATLMLPGDTFPTVAAYPIYDAEQPVNLTPGYETVTTNSTYTWTAGSDSSSYVEALLPFNLQPAEYKVA